MNYSSSLPRRPLISFNIYGLVESDRSNIYDLHIFTACYIWNMSSLFYTSTMVCWHRSYYVLLLERCLHCLNIVHKHYVMLGKLNILVLLKCLLCGNVADKHYVILGQLVNILLLLGCLNCWKIVLRSIIYWGNY